MQFWLSQSKINYWQKENKCPIHVLEFRIISEIQNQGLEIKKTCFDDVFYIDNLQKIVRKQKL